jgi:hypothetical protein
MNLSTILGSIPQGLRDPLIAEYNSIIQHYLEKRWTGSELSGGKFCEIVYTILDGYAKGVYDNKPSKPNNFVDACKRLESFVAVPRSFQILIPRVLPSLYEIRNNRSVGHVGGDVDSNPMDSNAVIAISSWILGELIRVYNNTSVEEAQKVVDYITNRKIPLVWETSNVKRVLNPSVSLKDQILLLIGSNSTKTNTDDLLKWIECNDRGYFIKSLRQLHKKRMIELSAQEQEVEILPHGMIHVENLISKLVILKT